MSLPEEVTIVLGPGTQPGQQFRLHHADGIRVLTHYGGEPVLYITTIKPLLTLSLASR